MKAIEINPEMIEIILRKETNMDTIKAIIKKSGLNIQYVNGVDKKNRDLAIIAVTNNGNALHYFQNDPEIVKLAIKDRPVSLVYATDNIRNNKEIFKLAFSKKPDLKKLYENLVRSKGKIYYDHDL